MSFRYGLSGNDIVWSNTDFHDSTCASCEEAFAEMKAEHPDMDDQDIWDRMDCCGHEIAYSHKGRIIFWHDTNNNFVSFHINVGAKVKCELLETDYLIDWLESDPTEHEKRVIRKELKWRHQNPHYGRNQLRLEELFKRK